MANRLSLETSPGNSTRWPIYGLASARPAASASNAGMYYIGSDTLTVFYSNGSTWVAWPGGAGGATFNITTVTTTPYAMDGTVQAVLIDATGGNRSIVLPAPNPNKGPFYFKRLDTSAGNTVTISRHTAETIEGAASITLGVNRYGLVLFSDLANWYTIASINDPFNIVTVITTPYAVTALNDVVRVNAGSGSIVVNLPLASAYTKARPLTLIRLDSSGNTVTINAAGSDHINAATSITLVGAWTSVQLFSNGGTSWDMLPSALNITASQITSVNAATITSGTVPTAHLPAFVGGGIGHAAGILPDPGATTDTTKFFRQDGTFAVPAGGGGGGSFAFVVKTSNYTITTSDSGIAVDASGGDVTITLPTASGSIALYPIVRVDSSAHLVSIVTTGGETINGLSTWPLVKQYQVYAVMSNNTNWLIEGGYYPSPLTTAGDLLVAGTSGIPTRLAKGTDAYIFRMDPSTQLPIWADPTVLPQYAPVTNGDTTTPLILFDSAANVIMARIS